MSLIPRRKDSLRINSQFGLLETNLSFAFIVLLSNKHLKFLSSLKQKKIRDRERKFLVEGIRLCEEAIKSQQTVESLLCVPDLLTSGRAEFFQNQCLAGSIPMYQIDSKTLSLLTETITPQGVVAIVKKQTWTLQSILQNAPQTLVAVENIRDPGNLGTILRSAAWFGIDALLLGANCVEPTNPKVIRASMGAIFHLPVVINVDIGRELTEDTFSKFTTYLADVSGKTDYAAVTFSGNSLLILGGETESISEQTKMHADVSVSIPGHGTGDSLNVSVAAAIFMAKIAQKSA